MREMQPRELDAALMPDGTILLEWTAASGEIGKQREMLEREIHEQFQADPDLWLFRLGFCNRRIPLAPSLSYWRDFSTNFIHKLTLAPEIEARRGAIRLELTGEEIALFLEQAPAMAGGEYLDNEVLQARWEGLHDIFSRQIDAFDGPVAAFVKQYRPDIHLVGRIYFHLVENRNSEAPFAFLATYATRLDKAGESRHLPLKYALEEYQDDHAKLLELLVTVQEAARQSELVNDLLESGELFYPLAWSAGEAFTFLREIPLYEEAGILCRIPNWWKGQAANIRLSLRIGEQAPATVGMAALLDFRPRLMIGDTEISADEARRLLAESEGLAFIKNKWIAVDPEKLRQTLAAYEKAGELSAAEGIGMLEAMRLALHPDRVAGGEPETLDGGVSHGAWLQEVLEKLHRPETIAPVRTTKTFKARLRGYQQQGLQWLHYLHRLRLGACLADDMGLGKTVQVLAFLNLLQAEKSKNPGQARASLLIIPASLLSNWINEIEAFSPGLAYFAAHPDLHKPGRVPEPGPTELKGLDLVITTYSLVQRYEWLRDHVWNYVILDEAQAIKNPGAKQTRAVKGLTAANRIVMTGTPIENRLADLWSLFDFLNPGLLGNAKEFGRYVKGLADHPQGYAGLRRVVGPFILRRLKSDKSIIADLPEKVEMKSWAELSRKQTVLYAQIVQGLKEVIESAEGMQRKGLILSALMKLKQLCNHPSQYLGVATFAAEESGKFDRLREICETIYAKRERVLVFTQFKEMTDPLADFLATIFERQGLILHGSVPVGKRKDLIAKFQGHDYVPFFVLSLKAGGVGLNLTAANHVIHFDRWWNPAVENQATDRVFRIGQRKNVLVHKFLTRGTIEEKIDAMLEGKAKLAREVVAASGENWITEMSNEELLELFTLR